jgi:hypothetical protein
MIQNLIVEGDNDIHLITRLCLVKGITAIRGYENEAEYKNEFVTKAGGKEKAKKELRFALKKNNESNNNIGIVIDADFETENPVVDTWLSIRHILSEFGYENLPKIPNPKGTIIEQEDKAKIGVWIMPNNANAGYLEHFFQDLILENDEFLLEAAQITEGFVKNNRNRFSETALQKAKVHTWLSWQQKPELPMGFALKEYDALFDLNKEIVQDFFDWFIRIFDVQLNDSHLVLIDTPQ